MKRPPSQNSLGSSEQRSSTGSPVIDTPGKREGKDAGGPGGCGGGSRLREQKGLLAAALRLLRAHVRCTCAMSKGIHASNCHLMVAAEMAVRAEGLGIGSHYGIHKEDRMNTITRVARRALMPVVLAVLLLAGGVEAQAPDTLTIDVFGYGLVAGVGHNCPIDPNGKVASYVGQEIVCPVWVIDSDGDQTPGRIIVEIADSSFVQAFVTGDSLLTVRVIRKGNTHIKLYPVPVLLIATVYPDNIAFLTGAPWDTIHPLEATVTRDSITGAPIAHIRTVLCAYLGNSYGDAVAKGRAALQTEPCPDMGQGPLPEFPVVWTAMEGVTDENGTVPLPRPAIAMPIEPLLLVRR